VSEAKENFQKAVEKKGDLAEAHYQLSVAEDALGEADAAIESGKKAVLASANSQNSNYVVNLAKLLQGRGKDQDKTDAEQLFKAAIAKNDKDINAHFYLGILYEKSKKNKEAKDEYKKVISLLADNSAETKKQLEKMISNIDLGVENTPENLGLTKPAGSENAAGGTPTEGQ